MATYTVWLDRYGDHYDTDEERLAGYQDYVANLSVMQTVFGVVAAQHQP